LPFDKETELAEKSARLAELNTLLEVDKGENIVFDEKDEPDEEVDFER
jgi:hypothetical protein